MLIGIPDWNPGLLESAGITTDMMPIISKSLTDYIGQFNPCFTHVNQKPYFNSYIHGLFSDLERKSIEPIALRFLGSEKVRLMQLFMKSSPWSDEKMLTIYQGMLAAEVSDNDGMITVDGCDFPKKGTESVGVSRQYCGPLGKTDSCQASVMVGYAGGRGYGLIKHHLYLPEKWFTEEYADKWYKCGIPAGVTFQTKIEIAIEEIRAIASGGLFEARWIGADSAFGHDSKFRDSIPDGMYYFTDVHCSDRFYMSMPAPIIANSTSEGIKATIQQADEPVKVSLIIEETDIPWSEVVFGLGSKGPIIGHEKLLRVVDVRNGEPNKWVWLYARRLNDGSVKYAISNAPEDTPLEKFRDLALRRWSIEQCFEECKSDLGMDHYEGRSWIGWHRHILIVFVAHLFLLLMRKKFSADVDQLSNNGQLVLQSTPQSEDEKVVILTLGQARKLINAAYSGSLANFKKGLDAVIYLIRGYAKSFLSGCNKIISSFQHLFHRPNENI